MGLYEHFTDSALTDLLKTGDRNAYEEIYIRYRFILHNHAWNKIRNKEEAQDVLQDVFANLWAKRDHLNIGDNLPGYLYSSVRNHILNLIDKRGVQLKYLTSIQQFSEQKTVITDYRVRENQLKLIIEREIALLPPRTKEVFELSRKQCLTHKEIAVLLGTTEKTVKKQIANALKMLRLKLGPVIYAAFLIYYK